MARIIYSHPRQTKYGFHVYTDLDFWDARRLLKDLALVKRNFGKNPSGDEFPTQIVVPDPIPGVTQKIEKRLKKAITSPPRHVIVRSMVFKGYFEFDPFKYYPRRWSKGQMIRFTFHRLPLQQGSLCNPYKTIRVSWAKGKIRVERVQRNKKHDPVIRNLKEAREQLIVPSCF